MTLGPGALYGAITRLAERGQISVCGRHGTWWGTVQQVIDAGMR